MVFLGRIVCEVKNTVCSARSDIFIIFIFIFLVFLIQTDIIILQRQDSWTSNYL